MRVRLTLVADGPSDIALVPIIRWTAGQAYPDAVIAVEFLDVRSLPRPPKGVREKVEVAIDLFPCDCVVVHRDAEREQPASRREEIDLALKGLAFPYVAVVPVRMTEAWLLHDEIALRKAAGNPSGTVDLQLPGPASERLPDPKTKLEEALRLASEFHGRRRKKFVVNDAKRRVSELIVDHAPLRALPAFVAFESELKKVLDHLRAKLGPS